MKIVRFLNSPVYCTSLKLYGGSFFVWPKYKKSETLDYIYNYNYAVNLADSAQAGSLCRPAMHVSFDGSNVKRYDVIFGEYVFVEIPDLVVHSGEPLTLDVKERSKINSQIRYPSGPVGQSLLKVYMPNNVTISSEAALNLYGRGKYMFLWVQKYIVYLFILADFTNIYDEKCVNIG